MMFIEVLITRHKMLGFTKTSVMKNNPIIVNLIKTLIDDPHLFQSGDLWAFYLNNLFNWY